MLCFGSFAKGRFKFTSVLLFQSAPILDLPFTDDLSNTSKVYRYDFSFLEKPNQSFSENIKGPGATPP